MSLCCRTCQWWDDAKLTIDSATLGVCNHPNTSARDLETRTNTGAYAILTTPDARCCRWRPLPWRKPA